MTLAQANQILGRGDDSWHSFTDCIYVLVAFYLCLPMYVFLINPLNASVSLI